MSNINIEELRQKFHENFAKNRGLTPEQMNNLNRVRMNQLHDFSQAENAMAFISFMYDNRDKEITIFGDYDADGVLATTVAYTGLNILGIGSVINVHVPTRADGYGISPDSVDKLVAKFPNTELILTVDNGVVGYDGVQHAKDLGIAVAVSDHHLGRDTDTVADVVVDINRPTDMYPFKGLSGTGVIWKLWDLYAKTYEPDKVAEIVKLIDLVGVSVVSDVMPAIDENRLFLVSALRAINKNARPQWQILKDVLADARRRVPDEVDEEFIGFTLAPLINSANRVTDSPLLAYQAFMTSNDTYMDIYLTELLALNNQRKDEVNAVTRKITKQIYETYTTLPHALVIVDDIRLGYMGLIANSLMTEFKVPVIVGAEHNGMVHSSARSLPGINLVEALQDIDVVESVGGHAMAGGVSFKAENREALEQAFSDKIAHMAVVQPEVMSDLTFVYDEHDNVWTWQDKIVTPQTLIALIPELNAYKPYGEALPAPVVLFKQAVVSNYFSMSEGVHSKFTAGGVTFIRWRDYGKLESLVGSKIDVMGTLSVNEFRGNRTPQVML
jgi:Single-stranded DNA-specific exonuclease